MTGTEAGTAADAHEVATTAPRLPFAGVLALLTMSGSDGELIEATCAMAGGAPARAVLPVALPDRVPCPWGVSPEAALAMDHRARHEDGVAHLDMLRRSAARLGGDVDCAALEVEDAVLIGRVRSLARAARLLVLAVPEHEDGDVFARRHFIDLVVTSGRPALVLPRRTSLARAPRRILVAWQDGPAPARAIHEALPWLRTAEAVRLVTVLGPSLSRAQRESAAGQDALRAHLARHGVDAAVVCVDAQNRPPEDCLLEEAVAMHADLLVAGAYEHPRALEFVVGGATINLLSRSRIALFMTH